MMLGTMLANPAPVLGYDARPEMNAGLLNVPAYREGYLFREDVTSLLSVDTAIWPSIFEDGKRAKPTYVGPQGLWAGTKSLMNYFPDGEKGVTIVAIQLVPTKTTEAALEEWIKQIEPLRPLDETYAWEFLGYDVADRYLTSSLFNCGLGNERHQFVIDGKPIRSSLNQHHLFETAQQADEFATLSDTNVEEHSPFLVYGIRRAISKS